MKAVLMRRHQTMADVVPITTLLAILICIGYCSDTACGSEDPGASSLQEEAVQVPEKKSVTGEKQQQEGADGGLKVPVAQLSSDGGTLNPSGGTALLEGAAELSAPSSTQEGLGSPQKEPAQPPGGQQTQELVQLSTHAAESKLETAEASQSKEATSRGGDSGLLPGGKPGLRPEPLDEDTTPDRTEESRDPVRPKVATTATTLTDVTAAEPRSSAPRTAETDVTNPVQPSAPTLLDGQEGPGTLDKDISEAGAVSGGVGGIAVLNPIEGSGLLSQLPAGHAGTKLPASLSTALRVGLLPNAQSTAKTLQADSSTSAEGGPTETSTQRQEGDPGIVSTTETRYTAPDPQTPLPGGGVTGCKNIPPAPPQAGGSSRTTETGIPTTQTEVITSATSAVTAETTTPESTALLPLPGRVVTLETSSTTTKGTTNTPSGAAKDRAPEKSSSPSTAPLPPGAGPAPPSTQATPQQQGISRDTPEEKKEQQKEVTGITPQGSPRQEGQQQKGQTPQGPPPLGSTSGATPGKDNTRETAKTPTTGTDTNNNNNNITIPKIAVNETIISATVVPSAIPAVLVCSVVFLYLSRR